MTAVEVTSYYPCPDHQVGFRQGRLCTDQIAILRVIIIEQSIELNSSLSINFVYYQKAFDSL